MKKLILLSFIILLTQFCRAQQGNWIEQSAGFIPSATGIRQIYPVDANVIYMIPYDSGGAARNDFSRTLNGGAHWSSSESPAAAGTFNWSSLAVINDSLIWALLYDAVSGHGGVLWNSTDAGANWTQQGSNTYTNTSQSFPYNVYFWNSSSGLMTGSQVNGEFECYTTTDGGNTWTPVDPANIPNPQDTSENSWPAAHFQVIGDTVWFDTNEGRIYRSIDRGFTWTAANTSLVITPPAAINFCFTSSSYGIARLYNDAAKSNTVVKTTDGGLTWNSISINGNLFGGDIKRVPGSPLMMVSTGISTASNYTGTSYTTDGGLNWTTIETGTPRGTLGIVDSLTMWCGGFTSSPAAGGVYKWTYFPTVLCTDPIITSGTVTANRYDICHGDTLKMTVWGAIGPEDGYYSGIGWAISSADISGSTNPLGEASLKFTQQASFPTSSVNTQLFLNDASVIDGINLPFGIYYWTPVFFGNAQNRHPDSAVVLLSDLILDQNCTFSGASVSIHIFAPSDSLCGVGISEIDRSHLSINSFMIDKNSLSVTIKSATSGNASIQILDLTGRVVEKENLLLNSGINNEIINVEKLSSGTYLIKSQVNGYQAANKVVKF